MDALLDKLTHELDSEANSIMTRITQIIDLLNHETFDQALRQDLIEILEPYIAKNWEHEHRERDLHEQVTELRQQLRESVQIADWDSPPTGRTQTALEAAQSRQIETLIERVMVLETKVVESEPKLQTIEATLIRVSSTNWELGYKCRDLSGEVAELQEQLRRSIAVEDLGTQALKPKTALERVLEKKIEGLARKTGRSRTKTM